MSGLHRYTHFIRASKRTTWPSQIAAVSAESRTEIVDIAQRLRTDRLTAWDCRCETCDGGELGNPRKYSGCTADQFWALCDHLLKAGGTTWMFGFDLARFLALVELWERAEDRRIYFTGEDVRVTADARTERDWSMKGLVVLEDPPIIVSCRMPGRAGQLKLVDIRNYGITTREQFSTGTSEVESVQQVCHSLLRLSAKEGFGSLQATTGSMASTAFRRSYLRDAILVHTNAEALALEQDAYYGGRCECKRIGVVSGPIYYLDFRTLYPWICSWADLPCCLEEYADGEDAKQLLDERGPMSCIARVRLSTAEPVYPVRRRELVLWPISCFSTSLCGAELEYALNAGSVRSVEACAAYHMSACLKQFSEKLLLLLQDSSNSQDYVLNGILKAISHALPGKFGQRCKRWEDVPGAIADHPYAIWEEMNSNGEIERWRSVAWHMQVERDTGVHPEAVPSIAGWITSIARMVLWGAVSAVKHGCVYYYDTDSVWCNEAAYLELLYLGWIHDSMPGRLRVKGVYNQADFRGIKHYVADGKVTCAGMPQGQCEPMVDRQLFDHRRWIASFIANEQRPEVLHTVRTYRRSPTYRHGTVLGDGTVVPFKMQE